MVFDVLNQPYGKSRYSVSANKGMVCSSNPLASSAGLEILKKGGNAVDAAIATAAVLTIVEPTSNGLGGDAYAIVWMKNKLYGLNASGYSPKSMTIEKLKEQGYTEMPKHGWIPVTIPGQPKAWAALIKKFGNLELIDVLQPAIRYAQEGFPLSPVVSFLWEKYVKKNSKEFKDNPIFAEWFKVFTKEGKSYKFGDIVKFPDHAKSLRLIGESYSDEFYNGEIANRIVEQSKKHGGYIELDDLREYNVEWVDPISLNYRGYDVWELPPNGQGIVTLMSLNILKNFPLEEKEDVDTYHHQFEAIKLAFADALSTVTDLDAMKIDFHKYLKDIYGESRSSEIADYAKDPAPLKQPTSGTVYLCTADKDGNMVSYIQSNYMDFGSGIVVEDYGIALQNRGFDFSLNPEDANALSPRKRSYHTIIPGFLTKDDNAVGPFGVMGGYMQPQGHLQLMMNYVDFHLNPQMCIDSPRWQWKDGKHFLVEPNFNKDIIEKLREKGHDIEVSENCFSFGRAQMIIKLENDVYVGATESRTDGSICCY